MAIEILMLVLCIIVVGCQAGILIWFLRRIKNLTEHHD